MIYIMYTQRNRDNSAGQAVLISIFRPDEENTEEEFTAQMSLVPAEFIRKLL